MRNPPSFRLQRATALMLQALAVLLFALHLYVRLALPPSPPDSVPDALSLETFWWGLWPVHALSVWQIVAGGAALLGAVCFTWAAGAWRPAGPWRSAWPQRLRIKDGWGSTPLMLVTAALVAAFYLFPLAHTRWGDAFMLAKGIAYPDTALRITHSWQAPLDVFVHAEVWQMLHSALGWEDAAPAYRLLSPVAGLCYLLAALGLSRDLTRVPYAAPPWFTYGLLATLGLLQLFFGYVENYSFAAAGVLVYLWLGLRALAGDSPLWPAATVLAITNATHPSTVILAPSLLYLGWRRWRGGNQTPLAVVGEIALPMLLLGGATFVWMEASGHGLHALFNTDRPGGGDARWFVPLWQTSTRWEHYTLFSWPHLRDWLNEQMLVAPAVLPALGIVAASMWVAQRQAARGRADPHVGERATQDVEVSADQYWEVHREYGVRFLGVAAGFYLLFTFVWNPDYGGQRDWDLFSLAALPTTLLLAVSAPRSLLAPRLLRGGMIPLLVLQGWHTWAWIVQNTLPWQWPD